MWPPLIIQRLASGVRLILIIGILHIESRVFASHKNKTVPTFSYVLETAQPAILLLIYIKVHVYFQFIDIQVFTSFKMFIRLTMDCIFALLRCPNIKT